MRRVVFFICLVIAQGVLSKDQRTIPSLENINAVLNGPVINQVGLEQVVDSPITYRVWGIWTLARPAREVAAVALDLPSYAGTFRYVYRCDPIPGARPPRDLCGTWYVEGRAMRVRVWAIGNIDSVVCGDDSAMVRFYGHQNENRALEKKYRYNLPRWLNYRTHGVRIAACVTARGPDSCVVGVVAQGWVKSPMPQWLIRIAAKIILPRIFKDLEERTEQRFPRKRGS